ncbi:MAG: hypothetical protein IMZ61_03275 [Planctomycetes bacterium]|nr:hypothetical protein [Planctomycetota bacterium]
MEGDTTTQTTGGDNAAQSTGAQSQAAQTQATQTAQTATAPFDYSKSVGFDGSFQEGWKNGLPEEIRNELCLDAAPNIPEMAKQLVLAQKMIGKNKVALPTDKSTPAEIEAFQLALGRPKTKAEYKIAAPQGLEDFFDAGLVEQARDMAFTNGFNQKQMDALVKFRTAEIELGVKAAKEAEEAAFAEAEKIITEEAGEALDEQRHFADMLIANECPDEEKKAKLLEALNANPLRPYVFNMLANIYRKYCDQHTGLPAGQGANAMTPVMMEDKAKELMATQGYVDGSMRNSNPVAYDRLTREITDLYNRAAKVPKQN